VVEALSPGTAHIDRGRKLALYRRAGVREYWIVDPSQRAVELHDFAGRTTTFLDGDRRLASAVLPGFSVPVAAIFATTAS
jgi:Uma2 family endonuclease